MLLTFAELEFLLSLGDDGTEPPLLDLLEHPAGQRVSRDALVAAGLASLVARGICRVVEHGEEGGHEGDDPQSEVVELDAELIALHVAVHGATTAIRVDTVGPERSASWVLLVGAGRAAFTATGPGVYAAVVMPGDAELRQQVVSLVRSALIDDPSAGVAISRRNLIDDVPLPDASPMRMPFRTNAELGGPDASAEVRERAVIDLVDALFIRDHPSRG
ncbi:MAG: hypothetical protein F2534_02500 [Actinobacteria bacterium]|uniref:Unannotated protein n=1 Tax=freshwater metagenome TaxID=449393 RepID=A0A6J6BYF2_9ZZZZ|nr:hypothetical protein [Actinomycetota bacterium]